LQAAFLAPEPSQQVFVSLSAGNLPNSAIINGGNIAASFFPRLEDVGDRTIIFTARDNGVPAETTIVALRIRISNRLSAPAVQKPNQSYSLAQNYPNPFNPATTIAYQLPSVDAVNLSLFDMLGRTVAVLVNERQPAGDYQYRLSASTYNLSNGVYFYRLQAGSFTETKRMILVK
jgi:hypothetical protein